MEKEAKLYKHKIVQIGILVDDLDAAYPKWEQFFGITAGPEEVTEEFDKTKCMYLGKPCAGRIKARHFLFDNLDLELIEPIGEDHSFWKDYLDKDGAGLNHIALEASNTVQAVAQVEKDFGMKVLQSGEWDGGRYTYLDSRPDLHVTIETLENDNGPLYVFPHTEE